MTGARDRLAFALDVPTLAEAQTLITLLSPEVGVFKVGLELFTAAGPAAVRAVRAAGRDCFLDLKLHDIGATVARAVGSAVQLEVKYLTLHAAIGSAALRAAIHAATNTQTRLLAITVLTSFSDVELTAIGMAGPTNVAVERLARLAHAAGIHGLVCSAEEVGSLRALLGPTAFLVTPGIREVGDAKGDQHRTQGPTEAIAAGSDLLVVGRPIRDAPDPVAAARRFQMAIAAARAS